MSDIVIRWENYVGQMHLHVQPLITVGRNERTCLVCGEVYALLPSCPRCAGDEELQEEGTARSSPAVYTVDYLREGEWRYVS